jgi:hypothetical protein
MRPLRPMARVVPVAWTVTRALAFASVAVALLMTAIPAQMLAAAATGVVSGSGAELCPWGDELPAGSDVVTGEDNTSNARSSAFDGAPRRLRVGRRLAASWSAYADGAMGPISPGCTVYLFDDARIDDIWAWLARTYGEGSVPAPALEPAPSGAPGEDGRLFHVRYSDEREAWTYLFRLGNVIADASIDVDVGAGATVDDVVVVARAIADRVEAAAAGSPLPAAPSPTPEPAFPDEAEAALLGHVPEAFRQTCGRTDHAVSEEALAAVACTAPVGDGSATLTYQQFADLDALTRIHDRFMEVQGVEPDGGSCSGEWPAEGGYTIGGEEAGRVACADIGGVALFISWTDERLLIHGFAEGFETDRATLHDWWLADSGPVG